MGIYVYGSFLHLEHLFSVFVRELLFYLFALSVNKFEHFHYTILASFNHYALLRNLKQSCTLHNLKHRLQITEPTSVREKSTR